MRVNNNSDEDRILVAHGTGVYDVTKFADIHPGGKSFLTRFRNKVRIINSTKIIFTENFETQIRQLFEFDHDDLIIT